MPFQGQPLFQDAVSEGNISALEGTVVLPLSNSSGAIVNISGTWVGTILLEGSNDDFVTVQNASVFTPPAGVITAGVTANGYYRFVAVSGFTKIRARMSAYTSGTAVAVLSASLGLGLAPTVSVNYDSMLGTTKIRGSDGIHNADVELLNGKRRLLTETAVTVENLLGKPGYAASWFAIGTATDASGVGAAGNQITVTIAAGVPSAIYPAVSYVYTITSGDVAASRPEISVRDNVITGLNTNTNFALSFKAKPVKDNGIVFVEAKIRGEMGDRPTAGNFAVTASGTTVVTVAFDTITRRNAETELDRSVEDPRQGILGVSGTVSVTPGSLSNRISMDLLNGSNSDFTVNGSVTPVTFEILADSTYDIYVTELRLHGRGNGIKFGQFMNMNVKLTNGITFDVKSDDETVVISTIKSTDDLKSRFSSVQAFDLDIQAGGDHLLATNIFGVLTPLVLRKSGAFTVNDKLKLTVNDDLTSAAEMFATIIGFKRLP